jgi:hypothetical protein
MTAIPAPGDRVVRPCGAGQPRQGKSPAPTGSRHRRRGPAGEESRHRPLQVPAAITAACLLLLAATSLQNNLRELFILVTLLRPGQLGTWRESRARYVSGGDTRKPKDPEALRELTWQVMARTRRLSVAHSRELPRRLPVHPRITLSRDEATVYRTTVVPAASVP